MSRLPGSQLHLQPVLSLPCRGVPCCLSSGGLSSFSLLNRIFLSCNGFIWSRVSLPFMVDVLRLWEHRLRWSALSLRRTKMCWSLTHCDVVWALALHCSAVPARSGYAALRAIQVFVSVVSRRCNQKLARKKRAMMMGPKAPFTFFTHHSPQAAGSAR